ncbi:HAD superfamily hydrolase (TIGR01509 family) [Herbaspirillum sp. Sphag1AN]|uniref:HAD-IA family hydrolase n=1 Tax=unclassified Herbaspirillum TaxID=2624150 RepID=UPI0016083071|nr:MULTISPECIES: HAD-IA family hydrolase [unclassified Herbaspirillum]MBB3213044.1 HAD superfamily hydrolase (TIGR01509 family) [Herbaspirillum sp. Sphag1AN]MBB3246241.1 HAD superfamily hydrolase (TIGR01509 family) [Herbaspirillum sp. Sphag64]
MTTIAQPSGITHLICDCDGVLLDSERIALRVLHAQLLPLLPAQHDADALYQAIAVRLGMFTSQLLAELDHDFSLRLTSAISAGIHEAVGLACATEVIAVPGVAEALQQISLPKAVASNSSLPRIEQGLARCGLLPLFAGHIHSADEVGHPKPAPHVYLAAAAGLGVDPRHCVAIDDSVTGVRAASAAGMRVIGFTGVAHDKAGMASKLLAAGAEQVFEYMHDLPLLLADLLAVNEA